MAQQCLHTKLGWFLSGPSPVKGSVDCSVNLTTTHVLVVETQSRNLDKQLKSFWELDP